MGTIYLLQCQDRLKVGFTAQSFSHYLAWLQRRVPFYLKVLATRAGTVEEEKEFHREHGDYRAAFGGHEWYDNTTEFRREAIEFLTVPETLPVVVTNN